MLNNLNNNNSDNNNENKENDLFDISHDNTPRDNNSHNNTSKKIDTNINEINNNENNNEKKQISPRRASTGIKIKQPPSDTKQNNDNDNDNIIKDIGNLAKTSPREVVQAAVSNFLEDTLALAEIRVERQIQKSSSNLAKTSPREIVTQAVSDYCKDTINSASMEVVKVAQSPRINNQQSSSSSLSPRTTTKTNSNEISQSTIPKQEKLSTSSKKNESQSNIPKLTDNKTNNKPQGRLTFISSDSKQKKTTNSQKDSNENNKNELINNDDNLLNPIVTGEKITKIPISNKKRKEKKKSNPTTTSIDPESDNPIPIQNKGQKEISSTTTSSTTTTKKRPEQHQNQNQNQQEQQNSMFPPISRPSPPPLKEKNISQNENPRNRKLSKVSPTNPAKDNNKIQNNNNDNDTGNDTNNNKHELLPQLQQQQEKKQKKVREKQSKSIPNNQITSSESDSDSNLLVNRIQSNSAPISDHQSSSLPPINGLKRSETTPRHKKRKKPLFLRLEDKAKKIQMEIEKEKMEMYHKIKMKRIQSQPTKEEIEQHMLHYQQQKLQQLEHEKEIAEARRKDWKAHVPKYPKFVSPKKIDFIDEQKMKEREEEEAKRLRLEKGKEFGSTVRVGGSVSVSGSPEKNNHYPHHHNQHNNNHNHHNNHQSSNDQMEVIGHCSPRVNHKDEFDKDFDRDIKISLPLDSHRNIDSPKSYETDSTSKKKKKNPKSGRLLDNNNNNNNNHSPIGKISFSPDKEIFSSDKQNQNHGTPQLQQSNSPNVKAKKNPKRLISQSSSVNIEDLGSPYQGKIGTEWVAEVMEMDSDETVLADVYETGFSMLMVEKGILSRDPEDENLELPIA